MKSPRPEDLRTGDIVLYSGTRLWSRIIRAFSRSKWSHVGIVMLRENGDVWIIESLEGKGVRYVPFSCWLAWGGDIGHGRVATAFRWKWFYVAKWCEAQVGKEYASPRQFIRSFAFGWSRLRKIFGLKVDTDSDRFFCSELIASALFYNGLEIPKHAAKMTPGDVANLPYWEIVK